VEPLLLLRPQDLGLFALHTPFVLGRHLFFAGSKTAAMSSARYYDLYHLQGEGPPRLIIDDGWSLCGPWVVPAPAGGWWLLTAYLEAEGGDYQIRAYRSEDLEAWSFAGTVDTGMIGFDHATSPCVVATGGEAWLYYTVSPALRRRPLELENHHVARCRLDLGTLATAEHQLVALERSDAASLHGHFKPNVFCRADGSWVLLVSVLSAARTWSIEVYLSCDRGEQWALCRSLDLFAAGGDQLYKPVWDGQQRLIAVSRAADCSSCLVAIPYDLEDVC